MIRINFYIVKEGIVKIWAEVSMAGQQLPTMLFQ